MIQSAPHVCRACGKQLVVRYDDTCPGLRLEAFLKLVACNRCADYYAARNDCRNRIAAACREVDLARHSKEGLRGALAVALREKLERLTKAYAATVCEHLRLTNVWEQDFAEQLLERPERWGVILRLYDDGLKSIKDNA